MRWLVGPGERKSIEPLAARVAPDDYEQMHHFVCASCWRPEALERVLAAKAERMVGGPDAGLIIDGTALLKPGTHSVGVARQYAGAVGKVANCQVLVSLTRAPAEVPEGLALRLFRPAEWTADAARCRAAGGPAERLASRPTGELALAELDRVIAAGVTARLPRPRAGQRHGRPRRHPVPSARSVPADTVLAAARWHRLTWRTGPKGPLTARFAAVRVVVADGPEVATARQLPGAAAWLVGEWCAPGERQYDLTNHPPRTALRALAAAIKARWRCEQAHQPLNEDLGLDHFEGRRWLGLHHHALLTTISFAVLQHLRLRAVPRARRRGKNGAGARRPAAALPARDPPRAPRAHLRGSPAMSEMQRATGVPAARDTLGLAK